MREYYKNDILKLAKPYITESEYYVYFLIFDNEIVYVGYSANVDSRIAAHKRDKHFNKTFKIKQESDKEALTLEEHYIKKFNPLYNRSKAEHSTLYNDRVICFCEENNLECDLKTFNPPILLQDRVPTLKVGNNLTELTNSKYNIPNNSFIRKEINNKYHYIIKYDNKYFIADFSQVETYLIGGKEYMFDGKVFGNLCNHLI